ncbi:unnamed protein product [Calicophoron daubneyi]|uniref:Hexosyltransferase n=1 Tax=Calicophoron daubneyi TaxID=300641 RepID=A0AAV2TG94_CALDB
MSYIRLLKTMFNDTENNRSELEKLVHLDVHHRLNGAEQDLQLYPKVLDLRATVSAIRSGKPTDQNPESDPELLVLQAPLLSCRNLEDGLFLGRRPYNCDLMVMVKSCTLCQRQRAHARSTYMQKRLWVGLRIEFVFVVGVPFFLNSSRYIVDDVELPSRQHVRTKNELRERRKALFKESQINNDMLIGGFRDSYENLTTKVIFAFRWASTFCKYCSPLFLFMDNDVSLIPKNVLRLVKNLPEEDKKEVLGGMRYPNREAVRPTGNIFANRHALTRKHYPWRYLPPFLRGGGYLVGSEKVRDAAIASAYVKRVRMEDVFTALIWEKLGYKCIILPGFLLRPSLPSDVARLSLTYTRFADLHVDWKTGEFVH